MRWLLLANSFSAGYVARSHKGKCTTLIPRGELHFRGFIFLAGHLEAESAYNNIQEFWNLPDPNMASRLLIFFIGSGPPNPPAVHHEWRDEKGKTEQAWEQPPEPNRPFDIKQAFLRKGRSEISEFDINVSNPTHLFHWLHNNDATQLSTLRIISNATDMDDDALLKNIFRSTSCTKTSEWQRLFELLATDGVAPNLKCLEVFWDCEGQHRGLGKSVDFIRALGKLRPKEHVKVSGFYALNWPDFLRREMDVPVIVDRQSAGLGGFQRGTEGLYP